METSYLLLIITCLCYGASSLISEWGDFYFKLINVLFIIALIVLTLLTCEDGFFQRSEEWWWLDILLPLPTIYLGYVIGDGIDSEDWRGIFAVLSAIGLIATIITTCCGI